MPAFRTLPWSSNFLDHPDLEAAGEFPDLKVASCPLCPTSWLSLITYLIQKFLESIIEEETSPVESRASSELHHFLTSFPHGPSPPIHQLAVTKLLQYRVLDIGVWRHQSAAQHVAQLSQAQHANQLSAALQHAKGDVWASTGLKFLLALSGLTFLVYQGPVETRRVEDADPTRQVGLASSYGALSPSMSFLSKWCGGGRLIHRPGVLFPPLCHSREQKGCYIPRQLSDGSIPPSIPS